MTQVTYDQFLTEVLPYVRDCPEFAAVHAVRNACIEFCELSHYLRYDCEPGDVVKGQGEYDVVPPSGYVVAALLGASVFGRTLADSTPDQLASRFGHDWQSHTSTSPMFFTQTRPETVLIVPRPHKAEQATLNVSIAIAPSRASTQVDSVIFEKWAEVIGFGARARLHETPQQPYHDEAGAVKYRAWFIAGCNKARIEAKKGLGRASLSVRMRPFL